jgi:hypothetical protein
MKVGKICGAWCLINGGELDNGIKSTQRRQVKETAQV